jgi:4-oxalocrotonate tautomerase
LRDTNWRNRPLISRIPQIKAEVVAFWGLLGTGNLTGVLMPMVQITMLQGRTADQKRKIAKRITDVLVEEAGARREGIIVAFNEVSKESYASGGELMIDRK